MIRLQVRTVRERIYWSYANLAMAHSALNDGATSYTGKHYSVRTRLYRSLMSGKMHLGSFYSDERERINTAQVCCYCGHPGKMTLDHLIPRILDTGFDDAGLDCAVDLDLIPDRYPPLTELTLNAGGSAVRDSKLQA